ncbi:hypothetical protein [Cypionkella psychrotolerans]|uniref:hypothetical protein n=1 Tax=Cypionkella psychrotolerans TaxID=1678131 RepID=UPI0006B4AE67|nr:hypothetical protein [Cypionkella psychrotolerans]
MGFDDFFGLTLGVQVALGSGYLAYSTAYAGLRRDHGTEDAIFISLAFGALATLVFSILEPFGKWWQSIGALLICLVVGSAWRMFARGWWHKILAFFGVHREDGVHSPWHALIHAKYKVGQFSVHTKNGRVLYLNDRAAFHGLPWDGLYLGGDGGVVMVVEEEELPDGTTEQRAGIKDTAWGTRLTYIPADEIERVNIRLK